MNKLMQLRNFMVRNTARAGLGATVMGVMMSAAHATAAIQTAIIAKIGELETWAYGILAVSLVAFIAIKLVKRFTRTAV